jgi:hypothetical protein
MSQTYPDGTALGLANAAQFLTDQVPWGSRTVYVSCPTVRGAGMGTNTRNDNVSSWHFNSDGDDLGFYLAIPAGIDTTVDLVITVWTVTLVGSTSGTGSYKIKQATNGTDVDTQADLLTGTFTTGTQPAGTTVENIITIPAATVATLTLPGMIFGNITRDAASTGNFGAFGITAQYNTTL